MPLLSESAVVLPIHRKILAFSFIGWIFDFYDLLLLTFLISTTTLTKDLALSQQDQSVLLGTALAFTAVGGFLGGALGDRYGRKPMLMITILVYSVGTLMSGLSTGMWTLFLARAITGIGVGGEWAVAHALVGETVPPHVRGRYGSYLQSGSAFARFFASMVGNLLAPWIGWRAAFMLSALPALIVVFIRRQMPESDVWLQSVKAGVSSRLGYVAALGMMIGPALRKTTALALTVTTFNMAAYWFKTIWLPTYLIGRGLLPGDVVQLLLMDQIGSIAGYVAFGFSSDYFGRRPSFTAFSVIKAVGLLMVTLGWTLAGGDTWTTYGFMLLVGFGEGNWGCIGPLLNEVFPTPVRAAALGIIYNTARGVQFLAPVVIGFVATRSSFGAGIALAVPFALLAGASVWALPETKGVRLMGDTTMQRQTTVALTFAAMLGFAGLAAAQTAKNDYADGKTWLCRPGRQDLSRRSAIGAEADACAVDQSATIVAANGTLTREEWKANPAAPIDCFYVYPTVSTDPGGNSDMNAGPEENGVVRAQLARFASHCRVYAPLYRQATLTQLRAATAHGNPADPRVDDIAGDVMANGEVNASWGLHLIDVNLAMGNLIDIVREQGKAYLASKKSSAGL